jgi:hypothetical protein
MPVYENISPQKLPGFASNNLTITEKTKFINQVKKFTKYHTISYNSFINGKHFLVLL